MIRAILMVSLLFLVACSAYKTLPIENIELVTVDSHWRIVSNRESVSTFRQTAICPSYLPSGIVVSKYKQRKNTIIIYGIVGYYKILYDSLLNPVATKSRGNFPYIIYSCNIKNDSIINVKEILRNKKEFKLILHNDSSKYLILYNCCDSIGFVHNEKQTIEWMFYNRSIE